MVHFVGPVDSNDRLRLQNATVARDDFMPRVDYKVKRVTEQFNPMVALVDGVPVRKIVTPLRSKRPTIILTNPLARQTARKIHRQLFRSRSSGELVGLEPPKKAGGILSRLGLRKVKSAPSGLTKRQARRLRLKALAPYNRRFGTKELTPLNKRSASVEKAVVIENPAYESSSGASLSEASEVSEPRSRAEAPLLYRVKKPIPDTFKVTPAMLKVAEDVNYVTSATINYLAPRQQLILQKLAGLRHESPTDYRDALLQLKDMSTSKVLAVKPSRIQQVKSTIIADYRGQLEDFAKSGYEAVKSKVSVRNIFLLLLSLL
ncbi:MAG: hypothetical protein SP1CHLAM54_02440 [Chlamydiia bacterium]|nr:hypothetical protein [Chlamydiia bacterium]MCH9615161.1 hypothetical protein [Chlamydiia bacterium]MCH9628517.1 hypothetical protein [Chlamydiia bacterium]